MTIGELRKTLDGLDSEAKLSITIEDRDGGGHVHYEIEGVFNTLVVQDDVRYTFWARSDDWISKS